MRVVARHYHEPVNYIHDTGHVAAAFFALPLDGSGRDDASKDHRALLRFDFKCGEVLESKTKLVQDSVFQVSVFLRVAKMGLVRADRIHSGPFCGSVPCVVGGGDWEQYVCHRPSLQNLAEFGFKWALGRSRWTENVNFAQCACAVSPPFI